jgi:hypothetical protein
VEHLGANRYIAGNSGGIVALTLPGGTTTGLMLYALKPEVIRAANKRLTHQQNLYDPPSDADRASFSGQATQSPSARSTTTSWRCSTSTIS